MIHLEKCVITNILQCLEIPLPKALPAAPASTVDITLKSRCSLKILLRYLYFSTASSETPSNLKLKLVFFFLLYLKCTTFVLLVLTLSLHFLHQFSMHLSIFSSSSSVFAKITMSSVNTKIEINSFLILMPSLRSLTSLIRSFINMLKSVSDRESHCLTPLPIVN